MKKVPINQLPVYYSVSLHAKPGYSACGYGYPGRKWRGIKRFRTLAAACNWAHNIGETMTKHKRPWFAFQIMKSEHCDVKVLLFAYLENETILSHLNSQPCCINHIS